MQVEISPKEFRERIREMREFKAKGPAILQKSKNSSITSMKTYTVNTIVKNYYIEKSYVRSKIKVKRIKYDSDDGFVYTNHRPIFVSRFKFKSNPSKKRGSPSVFVNIKKSESGGHIKGAFVAPIKNKHGEHTGKVGVFVRTNEWNKYSGNNEITKKIAKNRKKEHMGKVQKLESVYGPGVSSMMNNKDVKKIVFEKTEKRFETVFEKNTKAMLNKGGN